MQTKKHRIHKSKRNTRKKIGGEKGDIIYHDIKSNMH